MSKPLHNKYLLISLALSLLVHAGLFSLLYFLPQEKSNIKNEPIMVDIEDLPELNQKKVEPRVPARKSDNISRTPVEQAPHGEMPIDKQSPVPESKQNPASQQSLPKAESKQSIDKISPGDISLFKPKEQKSPEIGKLYPSSGGLAKIEESYRKKYNAEVKEGDTRFLNTDDIQFGSFLRRFETSVYGVWRYPAEASKLGIEGITPVRITFNRKGEIEAIEILESSGSRILDDEVRRTLSAIGPIGSFPKGYDKEKFNLIAFFHYGIASGSIRGRLY